MSLFWDILLGVSFAVVFLIAGVVIAYESGFLVKPSNPSGNDSLQYKISGVWMTNLDLLSTYKGSYICINVKTMDSPEIIENVCKHEVGHEIYNRYCNNSCAYSTIVSEALAQYCEKDDNHFKDCEEILE